MNIKNSLRREVLIANLKNELIGNLAALLSKPYHDDNEVVVCSDFYGKPARECFKGGRDATSKISGENLGLLGLYLLFAAPVTHISTQFLDEALTSGEFLSFQKESSTFEFSLFQNKMSELKENIDRVRIFAEDSNWKSRLAKELLDMPKDANLVNIKNEKLEMAFALQDCEQNVVKLLSAILKYFKGDENILQHIQLNPRSPFAEIVESQQQEQITKADVLAWLNLQP